MFDSHIKIITYSDYLWKKNALLILITKKSCGLSFIHLLKYARFTFDVFSSNDLKGNLS